MKSISILSNNENFSLWHQEIFCLVEHIFKSTPEEFDVFLWKLTVLENFLVFSQRSFMSEAILKYVFEYLHFAQNKYLNTFRILCSKLYVLKSFSQFRTLIRLFRLQTTTLAGWNQQIMSQNLLVNFLSMKYTSIEDVMTIFY